MSKPTPLKLEDVRLAIEAVQADVQLREFLADFGLTERHLQEGVQLCIQVENSSNNGAHAERSLCAWAEELSTLARQALRKRPDLRNRLGRLGGANRRTAGTFVPNFYSSDRNHAR